MLYFCLHPNFLKRINFVFLSKCLRSILVIADHNNYDITPSTSRLLTAAQKIGGDITVLVAGVKCQAASKPLARAAKVEGFKRILLAESTAFDSCQDENLTELILSLQKDNSFTHIIAGASGDGKSVIPRVAAKLDVTAISDVIKIINYNTFIRPIYSGNAHITIKTKESVNVMTIRENSFTPCALQENSKLASKLERIIRAQKVSEIVNSKHKVRGYDRLQQLEESIKNWKLFIDQGIPISPPACDLGLKSIVRSNNTPSYKKRNLLDAKIIICGGKGLKTPENFNLLHQLAYLLNAAVGASGAAIDAGIAPREMEIGQNGKIVAPNLYFAIGVSGKTQHTVGMRESNIVVAINNDSKAPIFKIADYCLIGNLFKIVPELIAQLKQEKKPQKLVNRS